MNDKEKVSRRGILAAGIGGAAGMLAGRLANAAPAVADCGDATAPQTEGPYYPTRDGPDEDADLTKVKGRKARAEGEVVYVRGRVLDENCKPIAGAIVEIWQANKWGRYDHERDASNPRPLDPDFQSWAEVRTGAEGSYRFKTIKPGSYPAGDGGWIRPPHIHFKISRRGYHELITQMYFAGEELNESDRILQGLKEDERKEVTVAFNSAPPDLERGARLGLFDITLRKVG